MENKVFYNFELLKKIKWDEVKEHFQRTYSGIHIIESES